MSIYYLTLTCLNHDLKNLQDQLKNLNASDIPYT